MKRSFMAVLTLVGLGTLSEAVRAEWPMARHDERRSSYLDEVVPISTPQLGWQKFLGGSLPADGWVAGEVLQNGTLSVLALISGNLEARRIDDALLWKTEGYELNTLVGRYDMDGDGSREIVVSGRGPEGTFGAFVFDPIAGALLWRTEPGLIGHIDDSVRIIDIDGDDVLDLFVVNANPTEPNATAGKGVAFGFGAGFANAQQLSQLATQPGRDYPVDYFSAATDITGDGTPDLFTMGQNNVYVYDLATGEMHGASDDDAGKFAAARARVQHADIDGDGSDEIFCFPGGGWSASYNSVRVVMFDWDAQAGRPVQVWERAAADFDASVMVSGDTSLASVTSANLQAVVSFRETGADTFTLEILDAATGELQASVDDARFVGATDVDKDGLAEVFVVASDGTSKVLTHDGEGGLKPMHELGADVTLEMCSQRQAEGYGLAGQKVPCTWAGGVVLRQELASGNALHLARLDGAEPVFEKTLNAPTNTHFGAVQLGRYPGLEAFGILSAVTTSGRLIAYHPTTFEPLNYVPSGPQPVLGMRVRSNDPGYGGLAGFPVATDLDADGGEELLVITSAGEMVAMTHAGGGPEPIWSVPDAGRVLTLVDDNGAPVIVVATSKTMRGYTSGGEELWERDITEGAPCVLYGDVIRADIDGGPGHEILFQTRSSFGEQRVIIYDAMGLTLIDEVIAVNNLGMRRLSVAQLDGPDAPPVVVSGTSVALWRLEVADGSTSVLSPTQIGVHSVITDEDGDGIDGVFSVSRAHYEYLDPAAGLVYSNPTALNQPVLGAKVRCGSSDVYVGPKGYSGRVMAIAMTTGEVVWERVFAQGQSFEDPAAADAAGISAAALANLIAVAELPAGSPNPGAIVGANDGNLYGLDACTGDLHWTFMAEGPVREVIAADMEGDGQFEVIALTSNGLVQSVVQTVVPTPTGVIDIDPPNGVTTVDIDDIDATDTLYVAWSAATDATYEVAVRTVDGADVSGGFVPVDTPGQQAISGLPLLLGVRYELGVRRVDGELLSPVAWSDGVSVTDLTPPSVTLSAAPSALPAGGSTALEWTASDGRGLAEVSLAMEDGQGTVLKTLVAETNIGGTERSGVASWSALTDDGSPLPEGNYVARLTALDDAGLKAETTRDLAIAAPVTEPEPEAAEVGPESGPEPTPDAGPEPDAPEPTPDTVAESTPDVASPDRGNTPESDLDEAIKGRTTGCDGGGAGHSPGPLVVLMLLLVLGVGRTRRRPSKAS